MLRETVILELRHLRYAIAVADELHFGRAARNLSMAQPPLSMQIKQLEHELGFPLFDRAGNAVKLTEAGTAFIRSARRILGSLVTSVEEARQVSRGQTGDLNIGFVGTTHEPLLRSVTEFQNEVPGVRVVMFERTFEQMIIDLYTDRLHMGFCRQWSPQPSIPSVTVNSDSLCVALPDAHPLLSRPGPVALSALANEEFIGVSQTIFPGSQERMFLDCRAAGFTPKVRHEAFSLNAITHFVAAGAGVALLPFLNTKSHYPGVSYRQLDPHIEIPIVATWREGVPTPAMQTLLRIVRQADM